MNILHDICSRGEHDGNDEGAITKSFDWAGCSPCSDSTTQSGRNSLHPDEVKVDTQAAAAIQTLLEFEHYSAFGIQPKNKFKLEGLAEDETDSEHSGISPTAECGPNNKLTKNPEMQQEIGHPSTRSNGTPFYNKNNVPHKISIPPVPGMALQRSFSYSNGENCVVPHDDEGDFLEELKSGLRREVPYAFVQWNLMVQVEKYLEEYYILYDPKSNTFYDFDTIPSFQSRDEIIEQFGIKVFDYPQEQFQSKNIESKGQTDSRVVGLQNRVLAIQAQEQLRPEPDSVFCCHGPDCNLEFNEEQALTDHVRNFHPGIKPYKCQTCSHLFDTAEERNKHNRKNDLKRVCKSCGTNPFGKENAERRGAITCWCFDENETDHDEVGDHPQPSASRSPSFKRAFGPTRHLKREREQGSKKPSRNKRRRTNMEALHAPGLVVYNRKGKPGPYFNNHDQEGDNKVLEATNLLELTKESPWPCHGRECARDYTIEASLLRHMKKHHARTKRFQCRGCNELFSTARERKRHVKQYHMSDSMKFWVCWLCGKSCSDETGQIEHLRSHEYVHCSGCGQNISKSVSNTHKLVGCQ